MPENVSESDFLIRVDGISGYWSTMTGGDVTADTSQVYNGGDRTGSSGADTEQQRGFLRLLRFVRRHVWTPPKVHLDPGQSVHGVGLMMKPAVIDVPLSKGDRASSAVTVYAGSIEEGGPVHVSLMTSSGAAAMLLRLTPAQAFELADQLTTFATDANNQTIINRERTSSE